MEVKNFRIFSKVIFNIQKDLLYIAQHITKVLNKLDNYDKQTIVASTKCVG